MDSPAAAPAPARQGLYSRAELARVLAPSSIVIIGASPRPGAFGAILRHNLLGFQGDVFLVNPRYPEIAGERCYQSVADLPVAPDCAVIAVGRESVEVAVLACADAGVGGVVIFASGYTETGKPERAAEQARLSRIARDRNIRIIGPNTLGLANFMTGSVLSFGHPPSVIDVRPHAVGLVSQSGALGFALAQAVERGVSLSHALTSGNSCDVDVADYVAYLAGDPACRAIACLFEGMANPRRLIDAAEIAWQAGKPMVVYKMASGTLGAAGGAVAHGHAGRVGGRLRRRVRARRRGPGGQSGGAAGMRRVLRQGAGPAGARGRGRSPRPGAPPSWRPTRRSCTASPCRSPAPAAQAVLDRVIPDFGSSRATRAT